MEADNVWANSICSDEKAGEKEKCILNKIVRYQICLTCTQPGNNWHGKGTNSLLIASFKMREVLRIAC